MFRYALRRAAFTRLARAPILLRHQPCFSDPVVLERCFGRRRFHEFGRADGVNGELGVNGFPSGLPNDTIYALSSAPGKAGIAVIRVSGAGCVDVYNGLCPTKPLPKPRYAAVRTLTEPGPGENRNIVDSDALVLYFPGPKTVTGEDVLELHVHGGSATVKAVLSAIPKSPISHSSSSSTIRYAEPGEFTRRAFFNNRLDLAQVESLGDTLAAETEQQRRAAIRGNSGELGRTYESWREQLLLARGEIEALIDFSEDQHFDESPTELLANVSRLVRGILRSIHLHEMGSQRSELLRNGIRIALLGPPNVGKSSLMNLIVGREASIVSSEAGTTRDIVEASLDIRGYLCSFADTAGIRTRSSESSSSPLGRRSGEAETGAASSATIGAIEEEGIRRARKKALDSDVIIVLASVESSPNTGTETGGAGENDGMHSHYYINYDMDTLRLAAGAQQCLVAINKSDAVPPDILARLVHDFKTSVLSTVDNFRQQQHAAAAAEPQILSCKAASAGTSFVGLMTDSSDASDVTDDAGGIHRLTERLVQSFASLTSLPGDMQHLLGVTERQNQLLGQCREHLEEFMDEAAGGAQEEEGYEPDIVLAAEYLRLAALRLSAITGRGEGGDVEDVLGVIFEKFCVGK